MNLSEIPLPLQDHFQQTDEVLQGKLRIRETRVSVEQVLELLQAGMSPSDIIQSFPSVSLPAVIAVERLAAHCALAML
jgi:uncharacterized protein (DUF433 family)